MEFENDNVRIIRITYGPGEKSVMHSHPAGVVVFLTDAQSKFTLPNGEIIEASGKAGDVQWFDAVTHLPENITNEAFEAVFVELKIQKTIKV